MELNEYQKCAMRTAIYPRPTQADGMAYTIMGLIGETGEVANHFKKHYRDGTELPVVITALQAELGDCLWYVAALAHEMGLTLGEIAAANLDKLQSRNKRGVLGGQGDLR